MTQRNYDVLGPNSELLTRLNGPLAERMGVTDENLEALKVSHQLRHLLFEAAKNRIHEPATVRMLAAMFSALESEQQRLWGFPVDPKFHRFFDFPGCSCPKLDNDEWLGSGHPIIALDCMIHWKR
jgi:hypothetical protein